MAARPAIRHPAGKRPEPFDARYAITRQSVVGTQFGSIENRLPRIADRL